MNIKENAILKINNLPDFLISEVMDYIDFISQKHNNSKNIIPESLSEEGMTDYLNDLEKYEERLARGEIKW